MAANAPQGGSSEAVSQVTRQASPVVPQAVPLAAPQEKKPNIHKADPEFVNLVVYYQQDGSRTNFRVRRNSKLQKLMVAFCIHRSLDMKALRVLLDGTRLELDRTPQELKMEDGDEIEVMIQATGGSKMAYTCVPSLCTHLEWKVVVEVWKTFLSKKKKKKKKKYGRHYDKPHVDVVIVYMRHISSLEIPLGF